MGFLLELNYIFYKFYLKEKEENLKENFFFFQRKYLKIILIYFFKIYY
jgi:hypothetical protein